MTKKIRIFVIVIVLLCAALMAFQHSPLYRKALWYFAVAQENKSPYKLSKFSINVPRDWIVSGENTIVYDYGKLTVHFASFDNGHVEDRLLSLISFREKKGIKSTKLTYRVGCKSADASMTESTYNNTKIESVDVAVEPDVMISASFIVDSDLPKLKELFTSFLSNNVVCVESSPSQK